MLRNQTYESIKPMLITAGLSADSPKEAFANAREYLTEEAYYFRDGDGSELENHLAIADALNAIGTLLHLVEESIFESQTLKAISPVSSFLLKDGSTTSTYMEGQYMCKLCGSSEVVFQQSASDASCQNCGEWQNDARSAGDSHE